jgi:hypothetical protein
MIPVIKNSNSNEVHEKETENLSDIAINEPNLEVPSSFKLHKKESEENNFTITDPNELVRVNVVNRSGLHLINFEVDEEYIRFFFFLS